MSNFVRKSQRLGLSSQGRNNTNLYVKNLEPNITDDLLRSKFSEFGKVYSAVVMKDEVGKSRGFGFVTFELQDQAMKAMEATNGSILGKKKLSPFLFYLFIYFFVLFLLWNGILISLN